ncbi:MAG TPA: DUF3861 domain-containing protein [Telluria sp.]
MKQHTYRITVEHLSDAKGQPSTYEAPLQFEVGNHDDLFSIVERMRQRQEFDCATNTALAVGLKLFSEVMLEHRESALFADLLPHFSAFMKKLKSTAP